MIISFHSKNDSVGKVERKFLTLIKKKLNLVLPFLHFRGKNERKSKMDVSGGKG